MSQAFISYHHAQRKLARLIAHRIAADGHSVWWDRADRPGDSWSEAVSSALARSACVIVLWSKQSVTAPNILGEATAGFGRNVLVGVTADRVRVPSPFDSAPVVDMSDWMGDSIDVAWIRLRDPIRAKMQQAEVRHVEGQALPPLPPRLPAPPPARAAFQNNGPILPPPPPITEVKRGPSAASALMLLAVGGMAAAGWYYRDDLRNEASRWQASLEPQTEIAAIPQAPLEPIPPASAPSQVAEAAPVDPLIPDAALPESARTPTPAAPLPTPVAAPAAAKSQTRVPTIDDWVPAPVMRQIPRAAEGDPPFTDGAQIQPVASATVAPPPPPSSGPQRINLRMSRFIDLDTSDPRKETDIWFAPDRSGNGLYLGVTNGARMRVVTSAQATAAECARSGAILRRTPVPARDLARGVGVCLRTSNDQLRVVHVEGIEGTGREKVLRLKIEPR